MAIELHCNHCGRLVRAPDDAGGKHGKCPSCHQAVYIPTPTEAIEPLSLEPVDPDFDRRQKKLMHETTQLTAKILMDKEGLPPEKPGDRAERQYAAERAAASGGSAPATPPKSSGATLTASQVNELVIRYAATVFAGKLPEAERLEQDIRANLRFAEDAMQRITVDEMLPPVLAKIPRPVLMGIFKKLRDAR